MSREIEDFLNTLEDWTCYVESGDFMPYLTFKRGSPIENMLVQCGCFDEEDLESYRGKGYCVFMERQVEQISEFLDRMDLGKIEYKETDWWLTLVHRAF